MCSLFPDQLRPAVIWLLQDRIIQLLRIPGPTALQVDPELEIVEMLCVQ